MIDLVSGDAVATVSDIVGDLLIELHAALTRRGRTETVTVPSPALFQHSTNVYLQVGCHATHFSTNYRTGSWSSETETERLFIQRILRRTAAVVP
jgi:hypothetical protein